MSKELIQLRIKQIMTITRKNMKIYYFEAPVLIFGILFPFFLMLAFTQGRGISIGELLPGLLGIIFFFTGSSVGPFITPWETRTNTLERVLCTPISISTLILGDITGGFLFGLIVASIILLVGTLISGVVINNFFLLIIAVLLSAFCFACLGTLFAALPTDKPSNVMMLSNLVRLPVIFVSGIFVPVQELPGWGQLLAPLSPVTYVTDLMRYFLGGENYFTVGVDFLMLTLFSIVLLSLAIYFHKKTILKRI